MSKISQFEFPVWDKDLFLFLNGIHYDWLDFPMFIIGSGYFWVASALLVLFFMVYKDRSRGYPAVLLLISGLGFNAITNTIVKYIIMRPRPEDNPLIADLIHMTEPPRLTSSFFSGHASNSMCLAMFTILYFRNRYYTIAILIWAWVISYGRIYSGKHYPLDVICGMGFGFLTGCSAYYVYIFFLERKDRLHFV